MWSISRIGERTLSAKVPAAIVISSGVACQAVASCEGLEKSPDVQPQDRHRAFCSLKQNFFEIDRSCHSQFAPGLGASNRDKNADCATRSGGAQEFLPL